jgi:hypothetical protein
MNNECKTVLKLAGIIFDELFELDNYFFPREMLLCEKKYDLVKPFINELKTNFSSSVMTSLQKNANTNQKWPLLNLVRQILSVYNYTLEPIRKCDGYTKDGIKKYKRFFQITKKLTYLENTKESEKGVKFFVS